MKPAELRRLIARRAGMVAQNHSVSRRLSLLREIDPTDIVSFNRALQDIFGLKAGVTKIGDKLYLRRTELTEWVDGDEMTYRLHEWRDCTREEWYAKYGSLPDATSRP